MRAVTCTSTPARASRPRPATALRAVAAPATMGLARAMPTLRRTRADRVALRATPRPLGPTPSPAARSSPLATSARFPREDAMRVHPARASSRGAALVAAASSSDENRSGLLRFVGFADRREPFAFFGAILLNVLLGSLYCWSCYLVPLEQALGVGRGLLSVVFSLTTVCFTVAVAKIGPGLYSRLNPAVIGAGAAVVAGAGLLLASQALPYVSVVPLFLGYALLFGVAAGVGYGLSVQISAIAPFGEGLSTGLVTSARAVGAMAFAPVIRRMLDVGGPGHAMWTTGALLLASSAPLWVMLSRGGLDEPLANGRRDASEALTPEEAERDRQLRPALFTMWAALCLGVQAGLMVVSHAAALLRTHGASIGVATAGVSIVSAFSTLGRVLGGWACDRPRFGAASTLRFAPAVAAPALAWAAAAGESVVAAQAALAAASFAYGVLASAVPVEVRRRVGRRDFARAYGFVYTAWGVAGLAAPALAGVLFDARGSYTAALTVATALSLGSAVVAATLKPGRSHEEWAAAIAEAKAREGAGGEDDDERETSGSRSEPVAPASA